MLRSWLATLCFSATVLASWYDEAEVPWNMNANKDAKHPLEYSVPAWENHTYAASPTNWRFPFYSFFLDRFVNGDPTNDDANGTTWEHDPYGTQLRHGGDAQGLIDSLDYLYGLGIRGIYIVGVFQLNMPWSTDSFSPIDHTILDHHFGTIDDVRRMTQAIHDRGMYVLLENTMATMADLWSFDGYANKSAPWSFEEHAMHYKTPRTYRDYEQSNEFLDVCDYSYPRFWDQTGHRIDDNNTEAMIGCMDSEWDQFGEVTAFGQYTEWRKQLSKFAGVQDRLREWRPSVLDKISHFSCMLIQGLDIDGFRMDKAMQITIDSQAAFSRAMRECAAEVGKNNFFIPGEVVNGNANAAIYVGRGKEPEMEFKSIEAAVSTNSLNDTNTTYIRDPDLQGLDAGAFHYTTYRALMRYLGLDGNLLAQSDAPINFQTQWDVVARTNDLSNAYTGEFDPRHMHGVSNQDVLRWPGLTNGTERQLLGDFIVTLLMPGIPLVSWGEEQAFYALDSTAGNYIFGRQGMTSSQSWKMHGCHKVHNENLNNAPYNSSLTACEDDWNTLDHRDPSHPVYGLRKQTFDMRQRYPVFQDGWTLRELSNHTFNYTLPGSIGMPTETGLWSVLRGRLEGYQDFEGVGSHGNQGVWLLHSNYNGSIVYTSNCSDAKTAILSPYDTGTTVKNLFYPFDEWTLEDSTVTLGIEGSSELNGCLSEINMTHYGFKAFVPVDAWSMSQPVFTKFLPGHDARILSATDRDEASTVDIEFRMSDVMDCDVFSKSININSTTETGEVAQIDASSISCESIDPIVEAYFYGPSPSTWRFRATLTNVFDGIHKISVSNVTTQSGEAYTNANDHFLFRIGQAENPMVFPGSANYSETILFRDDLQKRATIPGASNAESGFYIRQTAAGAEKWRYSMTFGSVWSDWLDYKAGNASLDQQEWQGRPRQNWEGHHVQLQYWSSFAGSSDHIIEGDLYGSTLPPRRFPNFFVHGSFNQYGFDAGIPNKMRQLINGTWAWDFLAEWPSQFQLNVWGMTSEGQPDISMAFGDLDNDTVLERASPVSLQMLVTNITNHGPESPHLAWRILFNDADYRYYLVPVGNRYVQLALWLLLAVIPVITGVAAVYFYKRAFAVVKFNEVGLSEKRSFTFLPSISFSKAFGREKVLDSGSSGSSGSSSAVASHTGSHESIELSESDGSSPTGSIIQSTETSGAVIVQERRTILIATMEYDISDWNVKIKIGGLGVMAQLMGKNLQHQDLIWVVPCVGGIDYPVDMPGVPIDVTILGRTYEVQVQYHKLENITYVLLDAPVFRRQSQKEPYPARMDDLDSAIYYSAWNQCIAEAVRRFPIDLYHINDYHGTIAPLYLLPETLPCCLSLHNAEFQGLWPMRNPREVSEICSVFNLSETVVQKYVQFGEVFNLLHAGASILRIHQKGFGAVGVSKKYGKRSWARYPIFWGLRRIGALPNPDPTDIAEWDKKLANPDDISIDPAFEASRAGLKAKAQEWAGLEQRTDADLFVFVGRWSMQKGIDLIADVFPAILEQYPQTQLICIGPTIDLHGKFAALKLDVMMKKYPRRVYSKPEFTALPPFIFSGAEFALIPSRDEPFGLVAVEFGRKGALGVGSRVGGLGQMPGWWFTVESTTTKHMMRQFKSAIASALKSDQYTRAVMRARSAKQRFPVAQWKEDLEILQSTSIRIHKKRTEHTSHRKMGIESATSSGWNTPSLPGWMSPRSGRATPSGYATPTGMMTPSGFATPGIATPAGSRPNTRPSSPNRATSMAGPNSARQAPMSLGRRHGPGHSPPDSIRSPTNHLPVIADEEFITSESAEEARSRAEMGVFSPSAQTPVYESQHGPDGHNPYFAGALASQQSNSRRTSPETPSALTYPFLAGPHTPMRNEGLLSPSVPQTPLSMEKIMDEKSGGGEAPAQDLMPFFTDPTGLYFKIFEKMLDGLSGKNSETSLCIEQYLEKSEKGWFNRLHHIKMSKMRSPAASKAVTPSGSIFEGITTDENMEQFLLPDNYKPPTGLRRILSIRYGDWPIYSMLLALGQIIAANSYQITLLTGQIGETATQLYVIASIYLATSLIWWYMFRRLAALYVLTLPWIFYGLAFFFIGIAPWASGTQSRAWLQYTGTALYAVASSSGAFFFSQNFGSIGTAPVKDWAFRACAIQGTQQLYVVALWFWGTKLSAASANGIQEDYGWKMTAIGMPIACFLWAVGAVLFVGLPDFYRQKPGAVPDFYSSILRRNIILWFFVTVFVQNLFLSAPYGRNWSYLWSSKWAPGWAVLLLVLFFFVVLWVGVLWGFSFLSARHTWILPMFAVGLGAPRWCQMLWSTTNIGAFLPWAGHPVAGALLGRCLWLWLGLLDSIQSVGLGMILLQTMVRFHVTAVLVAAQVIGSIATIIARADGLNSEGPGKVFPSFAVGYDGLTWPWFWVALILQLVICAGFFKFFRGEQLTKP